MPITKKTPISKVVKDFQKSSAPQFKGKSQEKRREMAVAAALSKRKKLKEGEIEVVYAVKKPYTGCQLTDMVKLIDPLVGLAGHKIVPTDVHSIDMDQDSAVAAASELYADHEKQSEALEEKKDMVGKRITKAIDTLEKKRKEHVTMAKEDPKNAIEHKEKIADLAHKIDDLMSKLAKVEKSKKNVEKKEALQESELPHIQYEQAAKELAYSIPNMMKPEEDGTYSDETIKIAIKKYSPMLRQAITAGYFSEDAILKRIKEILK